MYGADIDHDYDHVHNSASLPKSLERLVPPEAVLAILMLSSSSSVSVSDGCIFL